MMIKENDGKSTVQKTKIMAHWDKEAVFGHKILEQISHINVKTEIFSNKI